jgi:hypothetical protein
MGTGMDKSNNRKEVTSFESICSILGELWIDYKSDKYFKDFIEYNDIGLPIAFLVDSELVEPNDLAKQYVYETWDIFLAALEVNEDMGWESLEEVFNFVDKKKE